jgi:malonyl-CoA O-methyltransferase
MNTPRKFRLDRRALARAFDRASTSYDAAASLQRAVRDELLERLQYFRLEPRRIVDLGCGTGEAAVMLRRRYGKSQVLAIDVAPGMLREAGRRMRLWRRFDRVCADAIALPIATGSIDLVFCCLMLQWCDDPAIAFAEAHRVLRPGGLLIFSTFGPDTLHELRAAWTVADATSHVSEFPDMPQLGAALMHAGMTEPVIDIERRVVHYTDARSLARELRRIGARNATADRLRGLTGRHRWRRMDEAYESRRTEAGLPATYEIIYGAAFAPGQPASSSARQVGHEHLVSASSVRRRPSEPDR